MKSFGVKIFVLVAFLLPQLTFASGSYMWSAKTAAGSRIWPAITSSSDGTRLEAKGDGYLFSSNDSGATWTFQSSLSLNYLTTSSDGLKLAGAQQNGGNGYIYTSTDGGASWVARTAAGTQTWGGITSSSDGMRLAAIGIVYVPVSDSDNVHISTNGGVSWTLSHVSMVGGNHGFSSIISSSNGMKLAVAANDSYINTSVDGGVTWTRRIAAGGAQHAWADMTSSSDGTKLAAATYGGDIYTSPDSGATWVDRTAAGARSWSRITSSSDGTKLAAATYGGDIYTSPDSGATWVDETGPGSHTWYSITSSSDGTKLVAGAADPGYIYVGGPAPACTVFLSPNPASYSSTSTATLTWSSTNASVSMYINNVGYLSGSSGSFAVPRTATADYTGTAVAPSGTTTCPATLTVTAPASPATTITASSSSIYLGQSTGIRATFAAGSGDTLTHDNIDQPSGTGVGATTNPDATKWYTFTPTSAGTYTFYARAQTSYFTSWTTYNSVTVTVTASPSCTVTLNPTSITQGASATLSYSSTNSTAFSINHIGSLTPNTSNSTQVSPSVTTDYTGTASVGSVTNTCPASLTVSCTPAYTCSTNTIQYTNSACAVSNVTTCVSPAFCSSGSSSCLYPPPSFNQSGTKTGHLQAVPSIVPTGLPTTLFWNVSNVSSCSVTGTNTDSWTGTTSGVSGKVSLPIQQQTTYALSCAGLDSSSVHESVTVNIVPVFIER